MSVPMWLVESLRFTVFPLKAFKDAPDWWQIINKEPPELKSQNPRRGVAHEEGSFANGRLVVESQPLRADCTYAAKMDDEASQDRPPNVGPLAEAIEVFRPAIQQLIRWENFPEVSRIAFGAVLFLPVVDRRTGYVEIERFLPFKVDPDGSSDLIYQINRPIDRSLNQESVRINRVSKWSVSLYQMIALQVALENPAVTRTEPIAAIRLELDINNSPEEGRSFDSAKASTLLNTLVDVAIEISVKGDKL